MDAVVAGKTYVHNELKQNLVSLQDLLSSFTQKEKAIAEALTLDKPNDIVAQSLGLSLTHFESYLSRMYDKAGVTNRLDLLKKLGKI